MRRFPPVQLSDVLFEFEEGLEGAVADFGGTRKGFMLLAVVFEGFDVGERRRANAAHVDDFRAGYVAFRDVFRPEDPDFSRYCNDYFSLLLIYLSKRSFERVLSYGYN